MNTDDLREILDAIDERLFVFFDVGAFEIESEIDKLKMLSEKATAELDKLESEIEREKK